LAYLSLNGMKLFLIAVVACALGFFGGVQFEDMRLARKDIEQLLISDRNAQHVTTVLSLVALDKLEAGETDKAKSLLARQIAVYHHAFQNDEASLPEQQKLLPSIDAAAAKSAVLREELQKEPR
jgi:hypothetical protein